MLNAFSVEVKATVDEGMAIVKKRPPDILLLGLRDGCAAGWLLVRTQRRRAPSSRILAFSPQDLEAQAQEAGCDVFLRLPVVLEELAEALNVPFERLG